MAYTSNVPVSGQTLGSSRPIINANFGIIQTIFDVNHQDFNAANAGRHTFVDMLAQTSDPSTPAGCVSWYCKNDLSAVPQIYMRRASSGAIIQMTNGTPIAAASGQTFLPGGLIMQFGSVGFAAGGRPVSFANTFPNNLFSLQVNVIVLNEVNEWYLTAYNTGGFTFVSSSIHGGDVHWVAIGN